MSKALSSPLSNRTFTSITQTAGELSWNLSRHPVRGDRALGQSKALLTHEDVKQRAIQTLKWQIANGIQFVRTHVDVSDPTWFQAMLEVQEGGVGGNGRFPQRGSFPPNGRHLEEAQWGPTTCHPP